MAQQCVGLNSRLAFLTISFCEAHQSARDGADCRGQLRADREAQVVVAHLYLRHLITIGRLKGGVRAPLITLPLR
jgi:hypothetical protein